MFDQALAQNGLFVKPMFITEFPQRFILAGRDPHGLAHGRVFGLGERESRPPFAQSSGGSRVFAFQQSLDSVPQNGLLFRAQGERGDAEPFCEIRFKAHRRGWCPHLALIIFDHSDTV